MDFGDSEELAAFRQSFRSWLETHSVQRLPDEPEQRTLQRWHQMLAADGWVGVSWPPEHGGRALTAGYESVVNEEIGRAGAPDAPRIGYLGRAILEFGTQAQQAEFLPGILDGSKLWCQGFSEPEAGSDLANLRTRAERVGDRYVLNGQKVWTSYAELSDFCLLLARTGTVEARHRAIAAFVVPLDVPGIEIRPIKAITGDEEFCEVFLTDVEIPVTNLIGREGDGWTIAMMTVAYERGAADVGYLSKFAALLRAMERDLAAKADDAGARLALGRARVLYTVLRTHVRRRLRERELRPGLPGSEMSVDKLLMTATDQALHETLVELAGGSCLTDASRCDKLLASYFYSRAASIYGGTSQIQKNIIAYQILGLPRA